MVKVSHSLKSVGFVSPTVSCAQQIKVEPIPLRSLPLRCRIIILPVIIEYIVVLTLTLFRYVVDNEHSLYNKVSFSIFCCV